MAGYFEHGYEPLSSGAKDLVRLDRAIFKTTGTLDLQEDIIIL